MLQLFLSGSKNSVQFTSRFNSQLQHLHEFIASDNNAVEFPLQSKTVRTSQGIFFTENKIQSSAMYDYQRLVVIVSKKKKKIITCI